MDISDFWFNKHNIFRDTADVWGNYTLNLTFEAFLENDSYVSGRNYTPEILRIIKMRNIAPEDTLGYLSQPFCNLEFSLFEATGDSAWLISFIYDSERMRSELNRTEEGAICFYGNRENDEALLIDFIQDYCLRMARTGYITGDESYFAECVDQFRIHRTLLMDQQTGLWSQGRGWLKDPQEISPGAWSRGHGWLLRGMVKSLKYLPTQSDYFTELSFIVNDLLLSLYEFRDENGMWHVLLNRDFQSTYPETSGTGMIAGYAALALQHQFIEKENIDKIKSIIVDAASEMRNYILPGGEIINTCEGPGPLQTEKDYIGQDPFPGNEHGYQAYVWAFAGILRLKNSVF